jgi:hypothetical protein
VGNYKDSDNTQTRIKFSTHAVAFLDILGFKNFIKEIETSPNSLYQFQKLLTQTIPSAIDGKLFPIDVDLECIQISDSFILSAPQEKLPNYSGLIAVSIKAIQISHALLKMGFLVRGGIAVGDTYRTKSNIFGASYQNSYQTEQIARSPRILLHESAVDELEYLVKNKNRKDSIFAKDNGQVIVDSIYPLVSYLQLQNNLSEQYEAYRNKIIENLQILTKPEDYSAREKWEWTAHFFNNHIDCFRSIGGNKISAQTISSFTLNYLNPPADDEWKKPFRSPAKKFIVSTEGVNQQKALKFHGI